MPIVINGSGTVTGISEGGLNDDSIAIADLSATGTASSSTYLRGDNTWSTPSGGTILKKTYYEIARATWTDSEFPDDDTVPQIDEGVECFTQAYTPTNTSGCDIWVTAHFHLGETSNIANGFGAGLFISSQTDALQVRSTYTDGSDSYHNGDITIIHKIATWSGARTFSLRASGTNSINYQHGGTGWAATLYSANASKSPFIIEEVAT
tara:strand:- start:602 stop:1225 length:624 start_codon:yes stop_codon:yes gene_type:complete